MRRRSRSTASDGTLEEPLLGGGAGGEGRSVPAPPSPCRALTPWRPAAIFLALWEFLRLEALWRAVAGVLGPLLPPGLRPPPRASARATAAYAGLTSALAARFDPADASHAVSLADLWVASFPDTPPPTPLAPHPLWKEAGWQGDDPRTDLRGGGVAAVRAALHLARTRPGLWARLRHKDRGGPGGAYVADLEYPFGAAGVAVAVLTAQACGLLGGRGAVALPPPPGPPKSPGGRGFLKLLDGELSVAAGDDGGGGDDEALAFALWADLAAAAYERLDADWEAGRASYMQFPSLAEGVREDLERALGRRGVASVGDVRAGLGLGR